MTSLNLTAEEKVIYDEFIAFADAHVKNRVTFHRIQDKLIIATELAKSLDEALTVEVLAVILISGAGLTSYDASIVSFAERWQLDLVYLRQVSEAVDCWVELFSKFKRTRHLYAIWKPRIGEQGLELRDRVTDIVVVSNALIMYTVLAAKVWDYQVSELTGLEVIQLNAFNRRKCTTKYTQDILTSLLVKYGKLINKNETKAAVSVPPAQPVKSKSCCIIC